MITRSIKYGVKIEQLISADGERLIHHTAHCSWPSGVDLILTTHIDWNPLWNEISLNDDICSRLTDKFKKLLENFIVRYGYPPWEYVDSGMRDSPEFDIFDENVFTY